MQKKILLLDGNTRSALAVTRSLGALGHCVEVGETGFGVSLSSSSRYAKKYFSYPNPQTHPQEFLAFLLEKLKSDAFDFLISTTDHTLQVIYQEEEKIRALVNFPFVNKENFNKVQDKAKLIELAKKHDIQAPRTVKIVAGKEDLEQQLDSLKDCHFPLFIKPRSSSQISSNGTLIKAPSLVAQDLNDLRLFLSNPELERIKYLAQEPIHGQGEGIFCLFKNGECLVHFSHRRELEKPPEGGVSVLSTSIQTDEALLRNVVRLLKELNWQGVAMIEFKRARDGTPYLMEINPRFWGSLQLSIDSGINFPAILINEEISELGVSSYIKGQRLRWEFGSLDHLIIQLKRLGTTYLQDLFYQNSLDLFKPKTKLEVLRLGDLGPFFRELIQYIGLC